jgi:hypothetical protein
VRAGVFSPRTAGGMRGADLDDVDNLDHRPAELTLRELPLAMPHVPATLNGGGGTRTPKGLRPPHFECGALPVRATPPGRAGHPAPMAVSHAAIVLASRRAAMKKGASGGRPSCRQSGRLDLNQRPLRPERSALPG